MPCTHARMFATRSRVLLIDPNPRTRNVLASRLTMQGYLVQASSDPIAAAHNALTEPPAAIVSDLWMSGISGVQLCRLLKAEAATTGVPVILIGPTSQRDRFWAERAGASAYVIKGRMGDLARALKRSIMEREPEEFFTDFSGTISIPDRIAAHLDAALFDSVVAAEVRALGASIEFDRLFDLLSQFVTQVASYRWLAMSTPLPERIAVHAHPNAFERSVHEARDVMTVSRRARVIAVEDEDAWDEPALSAPIMAPIRLAGTELGKVALSPRGEVTEWDYTLVRLLGQELGSPLRIATLIEESQRLARVDPLTGLYNRRAFLDALDPLVRDARTHKVDAWAVLLDIDHFKHINDRRGHLSGDRVIAALGALLNSQCRVKDLAARWGGEEFILVFVAEQAEARVRADDVRAKIELMDVMDAREGHEERIPVTASLGLARLGPNDSIESWIDRADRAMYTSKTSGRNRVSEIDPVDAAQPAA